MKGIKNQGEKGRKGKTILKEERERGNGLMGEGKERKEGEGRART